MKHIGFHSIAMTLLILGLPQPTGAWQLPGGQIVDSLTRREQRSADGAIIFGCGQTREDEADQRDIETLVRFGPSVIPAIDAALTRVEVGGSSSATNAGLLLFAYSRLAGSAALPRLRLMLSNPKLQFLRPGLESAAANALGVT